MLYHDYEGDYERAKAANDGRPPALSEVMLQTVFSKTVIAIMSQSPTIRCLAVSLPLRSMPHL